MNQPEINIGSFNNEEFILLLKLNREDWIPISSPYGNSLNTRFVKVDKELPGKYAYIGSSFENETLSIWFLKPASLNKNTYLARWEVNTDGIFVRQSGLELELSDGILTRNYNFIHTVDPKIFIGIIKPWANDLSIYYYLTYVFDRPFEAQDYINNYLPSRRLNELNNNFCQSRLHGVSIFNHNYTRNIPIIDSLYRDLFDDLYFVAPCVAPVHERCMTYPAGSYRYALAISLAIKKWFNSQYEDNEWIIFFQDDVLLSKRNLKKFIELVDNRNYSCAYYYDVSTTPPNFSKAGKNWSWNQRVLNSFKPGNTYGHGFESNIGFINERKLMIGVGDIFAIKYKFLKKFVEILDALMAVDLFPETSIPTSLKILARTTGTYVFNMNGVYLWRDDRKKVGDDSFIEEVFSKADHFFLHPCKGRRQEEYYKTTND